MSSLLARERVVTMASQPLHDSETQFTESAAFFLEFTNTCMENNFGTCPVGECPQNTCNSKACGVREEGFPGSGHCPQELCNAGIAVASRSESWRELMSHFFDFFMLPRLMKPETGVEADQHKKEKMSSLPR